MVWHLVGLYFAGISVTKDMSATAHKPEGFGLGAKIGHLGCLIGHSKSAFPGFAIIGICCRCYKNVCI